MLMLLCSALTDSAAIVGAGRSGFLLLSLVRCRIESLRVVRRFLAARSNGGAARKTCEALWARVLREGAGRAEIRRGADGRPERTRECHLSTEMENGV